MTTVPHRVNVVTFCSLRGMSEGLLRTEIHGYDGPTHAMVPPPTFIISMAFVHSSIQMRQPCGSNRMSHVRTIVHLTGTLVRMYLDPGGGVTLCTALQPRLEPTLQYGHIVPGFGNYPQLCRRHNISGSTSHRSYRRNGYSSRATSKLGRTDQNAIVRTRRRDLRLKFHISDIMLVKRYLIRPFSFSRRLSLILRPTPAT